jgi:glycine/D-amino acid oxidase-like deaminating enzyme
VTSLLARVFDLGALLYTKTPVEATSSDEHGSISLRTPRGTTKAKKVIYATNGYSSAVLPQYEGVIVPYKGQASHLVPNDEKHGAMNLTHTYNLYYSMESVDYLVPRPDGSIILGGATRVYRKDMDDRNPKWFNNVDDSTLIDDGVKSEFDATMAQNFRGWEESEANVDETWSGSTYTRFQKFYYQKQ